MEEEERLHVGLAKRDRQRLPVVLALRCLVDWFGRRDLTARVEARLGGGDLRLNAELRVVDRQRGARLSGAVERLGEHRLELRVVVDGDSVIGRVGMLEARRQA